MPGDWTRSLQGGELTEQLLLPQGVRPFEGAGDFP